MTRRARESIRACIVVVVAIVSISTLEGIALHEGIDGTLLVPVVAAIVAVTAGFCGFKVRDIFKNK